MHLLPTFVRLINNVNNDNDDDHHHCNVFFSILVDDKYSKNEFIFKWENIGHHFFRGMGDNPEENGSPKAKRKKELTGNEIFVEGRINVLQQIYSSELL